MQPRRGVAVNSTYAADVSNTLFEALANDQRRSIIRCFSESPDSVATVGELAEYVMTHCSTARNIEQLESRLHHVSLPKLSEAGLVEYDPRSNTVRYCSNTAVEGLLDELREHE